MCANGGGFGCLVVGCWFTADCAWSKLSKPFQPVCLSCLHSLATNSCSSATCCRRSPPWAHLLQAGLLPVPDAQERSSAMPRPLVVTDTPWSRCAPQLLLTVLPGVALHGSDRELSLLLTLFTPFHLFSCYWWVSVFHLGFPITGKIPPKHMESSQYERR